MGNKCFAPTDSGGKISKKASNQEKKALITIRAAVFGGLESGKSTLIKSACTS